MTQAMLEVRGLKKTFGEHTVLDGVDLQVNQGEVVAIIGPSGTGKSTLLRCINLLEMPEEGSIRLGKVEVSAPNISRQQQYQLRGQSSMVFQQYSLFSNKTALENIMAPLLLVQKMDKPQAEKKAQDVLRMVGLADKANEYPSRLSGGQQQRIGIGRAMVTGPKLVLLDEPTSSLDPELVGGVLEVIRKLAARHMTMLLTTHEMGFARSVADRVIFLADGKVQEQGTPQQIFDHPQSGRLKSFLNTHRRRDG
ncbi:putative ABC transporter ATP-binding protein [Clostridium sp. CAG:169]|nr:putative ABC transporter ATP-binding protein [Clostridium sp. CAG:169]